MKFQLPYGRSFIEVDLPDHLQVDLLEPPLVPPARDPLAAVRSALDEPLGVLRLADYAGVKSVAVAVNDKTRPVPMRYLLPPLLEKLASVGIAPEVVTLIVAVGLHAPMTPEEFPAIIPPQVLSRYPVISHDAKDGQNLLNLGDTSRGTPVWANAHFARAELRIVVGNIEPHQFAGFSGGVKTAAIGLGGAQTIQHNHSLLKLPGARLGEVDANPVRQDVEEIGQRMGVHFALNAVLNQDKQIVNVLAGDPLLVMRQGVPLSRQVSQLGVAAPYDLLIASPGGHPKDLNLYQAQKGLAHAALIVKPGGSLLLAAACPEGSGSQSFESWISGAASLDDVLERFAREEFRIGPHKAYLIARDASKINLLLYSDIPPGAARALLLQPVEHFQTALDQALARLEKGGRIGILPHASSTIPFLQSPAR